MDIDAVVCTDSELSRPPVGEAKLRLDHTHLANSRAPMMRQLQQTEQQKEQFL